MKQYFQFILITSATLILFACNSNYTVSKKRGFFRIDLPKRAYQKFEQPGYPYSFEYPVYAIKDTAFFEDKPENPWWINIDFPQFAARVHLSYKIVTARNFDTLVNDAFKMAYKQHTSKASDIIDSEFVSRRGINGIYFTLAGNTATGNQFFLTDTTRHFLRGALYFNATPNEDSISVVNNFLKEDLRHLINTLEWK
jgi:gliding motility-associated lipoprotein GldD